MWESAVEMVRAAIFATANLCAGSLGGAVLLVSFGLRLAMLPIALRMARHARAQQERLAELKPALEALQRKFKSDPARQFREIQALHRKHGIRLFTPDGFVSLVVQMPIFSALFAATRQGLGAGTRFLWVADLARPDRWLALSVALLTGAIAASAVPTASAPSGLGGWTLGLTLGGITLLFVWSASSAVALSVGGGALVSVLQNWLLARDNRAVRIGAGAG